MTTTKVQQFRTVPAKDAVDKRMRSRIRLYVLDEMRDKGLTKADVARATRMDKSALSKFLAPHGELTLGLDNYFRLVRGLGLNANQLVHRPHPREKLDKVGEGSASGHTGRDPGL